MLDNISESTTNNHSNSQSNHHQTQQQQTNANAQIPVDFNSILQELKSVGQAHQSEQQTTMIVENITAHIKQESQSHSNETSRAFLSKGNLSTFINKTNGFFSIGNEISINI
jgi:hypothetical protein